MELVMNAYEQLWGAQNGKPPKYGVQSCQIKLGIRFSSTRIFRLSWHCNRRTNIGK